MPNARSILRSKGGGVITVTPTTSVLDAANVMNQHHVGSVVVMDDDELAGIFTERDVMRRVVVPRRDPASTRVGDVMTSPVACAATDTTTSELAATMRKRKIRHLPVLADGHLVGMISIGDINRADHDEQSETIRYLERYMTIM